MPAFVGHYLDQPHKLFVAIGEEHGDALRLAGKLEAVEPTSVRSCNDYAILRIPVGIQGQDAVLLEPDEAVMLLPGHDLMDAMLYPRSSSKARPTRSYEGASRPNLYVNPKDPGHILLALGFDEDYLRRIIPGARHIGDADDLVNFAFSLKWTGSGFQNNAGPVYDGELDHLRGLIRRMGGSLQATDSVVEMAVPPIAEGATEEPVVA
jgi:hypothetical protein